MFIELIKCSIDCKHKKSAKKKNRGYSKRILYINKVGGYA